jgi:two-component system sensor histidine kinase KdpD
MSKTHLKFRRIVSVTTGLVAVCAVTLVLRAPSAVNATTVGFAYLITILLIAAKWGIVESVIASILATLFFSYFFLPPVGFAVAATEDWVALAAFLVSSLIAGELSDQARRRALEAKTGQTEMEKLYALSRSIMLMEGNEAIGAQLARGLVTICEIPSVAIYDRVADVFYCSGEAAVAGWEFRLKETAASGTPFKDDHTDTLFTPITLAGQSNGSIAMQGGQLSKTALKALVNLLAITLEHARSREIALRAQAARQSEQFKSTLLDGLAHEFKTPLTSIRAATTALLGENVSDATQQLELLTIVDQEVERLSRLVTEATHVARIEAGKIDLNREWHQVDVLIDQVLAETEVLRDGRPVNVSIELGLPRVRIDANLVQLALRQLVDNALKYSPRRSAIEVDAKLSGENLAISVHNEGEPLSEAEQSRIFDKFYRGQNVRRQVAGTGMGLSVARDILLAHGGDVYLNRSNHRGTEFVLRIPLLPAGQGEVV